MLQFSIRSLLLLTAAVAGLAWIFFAPPHWLGVLVLYFAYLMLPAVAVAGVVYHRGAWQAFFIGMLPWVVGITIFCWIMIVDDFPRFGSGRIFDWPNGGDAEELILYKLYCTIPLSVTGASGFAAMGIWAWASAAQRPAPPRQAE